MFQTKVKTAVSACAALVVVIGCTGLAQEGAKPSPAKNIVYVATDGSGDYKTDGTDDQVEINKALLDIHKKGGGTVHIKKGTYTIGETILIHSNTVLEGDGRSTVILLKEKVDWSFWTKMVTNEKGGTNITVRNLKIDGQRGKQKVTWGARGTQAGICLNGASNVTMTGLWIGNNNWDAITVNRSKNILIQDNTLDKCGHDGVHAYHSEAIKIVNNRFIISCNVAIRLAATNRTVIRGNIMHPYFGSGIDVGGGKFTKGGKGGNGIQLQFYPKSKMDDILIENNVIFGTNGAGINAWTERVPAKPNMCSVTVRNNIIFYCHGGGITNNNFDMLIENNTIHSNRPFGIGFHKAPGGGYFRKLRNAGFPVTLTVRNNIIVNNVVNRRSKLGGHGLTTSGAPGNVRILSSYNNVWKNAGKNYDGNVTAKHDISVDPLFVNASGAIAWPDPKHLEMDFHVKSQHGRWNGKKWGKDDVTSPCIDAGDPTSPYSLEPLPNGKRTNIGAYGNTKEASKSG